VTGSDKKNSEATLVAAAEQCARLVSVLKRNGARHNLARLGELVAELEEVQRLAAQVCAPDWVADEQMVKLTLRFDRVSAMLFEEINSCNPKPF
jgi:hypothetical protein